MADGYKNAGEHDFADLDEWLCEYVDGTIDPAVCKALEEYMQHNPALASHVEQLCETRHLLCQYGCSYQAPSGLQPRLRRRLATEIIQESQPLLGTSTTHLMALATLTSLFAIILIFAATSTHSISSDALPETSERAISKDLPFMEQQLLPANRRRSTPFAAPALDKDSPRFTRQPALSRPGYSSQDPFLSNTFQQRSSPHFALQRADAYTTP